MVKKTSDMDYQSPLAEILAMNALDTHHLYVKK